MAYEINYESARRALEAPMGKNDANAATIREYLIKLLDGVWRDREIFSGKRPFGNSGWQYEIYEALVRADLISGSFDEDGDLDIVDEMSGDALIDRAIELLAELPF